MPSTCTTCAFAVSCWWSRPSEWHISTFASVLHQLEIENMYFRVTVVAALATRHTASYHLEHTLTTEKSNNNLNVTVDLFPLCVYK